MCIYACEDAELILYSFGQSKSIRPEKTTSILENLDQFKWDADGFRNTHRSNGNTGFSFEYVDELLKNNTQIDNFILVTNESLISQPPTEGILSFISKYRSMVNPHLVKLHSININISCCRIL